MGEPVTHFTDAAEWTGVMSTEREKWLAMRQELLTASDVAAILGHDKRRSALAVYVDKVTPRGPEASLALDDPRFWGNVLEQPILRAVANHNGWGYHPGGALLRSKRHPWLGATLDAEIDRNDGRGWVDLEGKTSRVTREWDEDEQNLPVNVLIQLQSQLLVSGSPIGVVFALLLGSRPCQIEVEPVPELHQLIAEESQEFMARVRRLEPPDPDGSESSSRALQRLHPLDDGSVVRLPDCAVDWTRELKELNEQKKRIDARADELKNLLRASIGPAKFGVLSEDVDGRRFWRWQLQKKPSYVVSESESRVLLSMKNGPPIDDPGAIPAAQEIPTLERQFLQSTSASNVTPIKRRRASSRR